MYTESPWHIRSDISVAHERALKRLTSAGSWWTGPQRREMAIAVRNARNCTACRQRAESLSPNGNYGSHGESHELNENVLDVIHRVARDATRLSESAVSDITSNIMSIGQYVELIGVVATCIAIDRFCLTLGLTLPSLPLASADEPDAYVPYSATSTIAWVPTISPEDASGPEANIYRNQSGAHIHRALSLVPAEKHGFFELDDAMYLADADLRDFGNEHRAISHTQIELLAARVSALNQCVY